MPSPTEITVTQLSRLIDTPAAPIIIDVSTDVDFELDPDLIPTALHHPFYAMALLAPRLMDKRVIVYCQKFKKLSQGAMAVLRNHGNNAETPEGGHFSWRDTGELLVPAVKTPLSASTNASVWITRHRPKIDHIACPWLIRRLAMAEKFDATPLALSVRYRWRKPRLAANQPEGLNHGQH